MTEEHRARWGQPWTGVISLVAFTVVAWVIWFIFSDPRGPVHSFPYPFVLYLAMMILVGLWQHMFLGDWPFQNMPQPARGISSNPREFDAGLVCYPCGFLPILGLGFNFLSQSNLEALAAAGGGKLVAAGKVLTLEQLTAGTGRFAERAVVCFVLIGFYSYPFVTILFRKMARSSQRLASASRGSVGTWLVFVVDDVLLCGLDRALLGMVLGTGRSANLSALTFRGGPEWSGRTMSIGSSAGGSG